MISKRSDSVVWRPGRRRRPGRRLVIALAVVVLVVGATTARLIVWPAQGMPARVNAIVMLNSPGDPLMVALRLARQRRADFLVISQGGPGGHYACPQPVRGVKLICFHPSPVSTQGEAEFVGRLAARQHWRSIALVTITPQAWRASLRLRRCFPGHVYVVTAAIPLESWPYQIAYEWGATAKALLLQRSC